MSDVGDFDAQITWITTAAQLQARRIDADQSGVESAMMQFAQDEAVLWDIRALVIPRDDVSSVEQLI